MSEPDLPKAVEQSERGEVAAPGNRAQQATPVTAGDRALLAPGNPGQSPYSVGRPKSPYGGRARSPRSGSSSRPGSKSSRRRAAPNPYLQARNERKTVEMDLQLMANRLARLQADEVKAIKKVESMRRKADEIVEQKQRNLQKYQMKYQHVAAEFETLQQQAAQQAYLRAQHRDNLKAAKEQLVREKRESAIGIRQASQENEWLAAKFKQEEVQRNRMSRDFIRARQQEFAARKNAYKEHLNLHLSEETGARIAEEQRALHNSLHGIEAMATEEQKLIANLQSLHEAHSETTAALEASLAYDPFATAQIDDDDQARATA